MVLFPRREAAAYSLSPWGEGWGEGGLFIQCEPLNRISHQSPKMFSKKLLL